MIEKVVHGSLLDAKEDVICHQCNCLTMIPHGLSATIAAKYPWADVYAQRPRKTANCTSNPSIPGTIQIMHPPLGFSSKRVVCLFGQWAPGEAGGRWKSYYPRTYEDSKKARVDYFKQALVLLDEEAYVEPVAMPFMIGCGLAGGDWREYEAMLDACATRIVLYKL